MKEKLICEFCNEKLDSMGYDASKCKECGKIFCNKHIYWANHNCEKVPREELMKEKSKLTSKTYLLSFILSILSIGTINSFYSNTLIEVKLLFSIATIIVAVLDLYFYIKKK